MGYDRGRYKKRTELKKKESVFEMFSKEQLEMLKFVEEGADYLFFLNEEDYFPELVDLAVRKDGFFTLSTLSPKWITPERCLLAVKYDPLAIKAVPSQCLTEEVCLQAVQGDGRMLKHIENPTYQVAYEGVFNRPEALKYVPDALKSCELCLMALDRDARAIKFMPQTEEYCVKAVKNSWKALAFIEKQTPELCMIAYEMNEEAEKLFRL